MEQVFNAIEGLFKQIKLAIEDLINWLKFIFDWPDILRTKEAIKYIFNLGLNILPQLLKYFNDNILLPTVSQLEDKIDGFFQNVKESIGLSFDEIKKTQSLPPHYESASSHNIVQSNFMNNSGRPPQFILYKSTLQSEVQGIFDDLKGFATQVNDLLDFKMS